MLVLSVSVRDFRGFATADAQLGEGITVLCGPNGAGKTSLLEALYFGCTGYSCRTANEREVVRFGNSTTRVVVRTLDSAGSHELAVGFSPGQPKRMSVDGAAVERLLDVSERPLVSVFLPDRLELIKGVPALRRAHLDQFVTALWPARVATRRSYAQTLAQRNALIAKVRGGHAGTGSLDAWDLQLARAGIALMSDRRQAIELLCADFSELAVRLGLDGTVEVGYRPRSPATEVEDLVQELRDRVDADVERGFTTHGPHRDDLSISRDRRELRTYGSQGQQRLGLLALLLAERAALARLRTNPPMLLLDDVMSELDAERRRALVDLLREGSGQTLITTTELDHVPAADHAEFTLLAVDDGAVCHEALIT
jgi:DNA replication and repair protein RecF